MQRWRIPLFACFGVALAVALAFVLACIRPAVAKAAALSRGPQPYMAEVMCTVSENACKAPIPSIPAGKRLVIEYVSVSYIGSSQGFRAWLRTSLGVDTSLFPLPLRSQTYLAGPVEYYSVMGDRLLAFAEGSANVVEVSTEDKSGTLAGWVSGYLEDVQ